MRMEVAGCLECGAPVGGQSHAVDGVTRAIKIDH